MTEFVSKFPALGRAWQFKVSPVRPVVLPGWLTESGGEIVQDEDQKTIMVRVKGRKVVLMRHTDWLILDRDRNPYVLSSHLFVSIYEVKGTSGRADWRNVPTVRGDSDEDRFMDF